MDIGLIWDWWVTILTVGWVVVAVLVGIVNVIGRIWEWFVLREPRRLARLETRDRLDLLHVRRAWVEILGAVDAESRVARLAFVDAVPAAAHDGVLDVEMASRGKMANAIDNGRAAVLRRAIARVTKRELTIRILFEGSPVDPREHLRRRPTSAQPRGGP